MFVGRLQSIVGRLPIMMFMCALCLCLTLQARGDTLSVATSPHPLVQMRDHVIKGIELDNAKQPRAALREFEAGMQICERMQLLDRFASADADGGAADLVREVADGLFAG